jgi:ferrochelatase
VDRIVVFPLYPQYASASTGSTVERVFAEAGRRWNTPFLQVMPPFYEHPAYIGAFAAVAEPVLREVRPERVLFSFHGLPERQVRKSDEAGDHCLRRDGCCETIGSANRNCYRAQCTRTARLLAERLGVPEPARVLCFQSRLGRTPWIRPSRTRWCGGWRATGVRRAVILSPASWRTVWRPWRSWGSAPRTTSARTAASGCSSSPR